MVCDQPAGVEGVDRVGIDDRGAMLGLARHLTGLGHRRVGVICMRLAARRDRRVSATRQTEIAYPVQRNRLAGLRDGLAEVGVDWAGCPSGSASTTRWRRASRPRPSCSRRTRADAIVCTSDILALGALRHAADRGLVPDDLTITGFDGVPEASAPA